MTLVLDDAAPLAERVKAAQALATSKDPAALDALAGALALADEALRTAAVASLQALKAGPVFEARVGGGSRSAAERAQAAVVLRHLRSPSSVAPLAKALADAAPEVRREAALALSVVGPVGAEAELIAVLGDPDADVRYHAAEALGGVKTPRAKEAIHARFPLETNPTVKFALTGARDAQEKEPR